jgi:CelD/BcsL family acetyltransferase involved in cellulose biosynthesis
MKDASRTKEMDVLKVTTATDPAEIRALRPEWEAMQREQRYPAINADIDRYLSIVETGGNNIQPYVILVRQDGKPVAIVIGRTQRHQLQLRLGYTTLFRPTLRCLTVVYGGTIGQLTNDVCLLLVDELMKVLRKRQVDMVFFNHVRTDSPLYPVVQTMPNFLCRGHFATIEPHWTMSVPENIDAFYEARSKKHRGNLRRSIRKLEKEYAGQVKIVTYRHEYELTEAIKAASQISQKTYQYTLGSGFVDDSRTRRMLAIAAQHGWLQMSVLYIGGEACAYQLGLVYGKKYELQQVGFDPEWEQLGVGSILFLKVLENICNDPAIELLDFGFGDADYKRSYGTDKWTEVSVYIFAPRLYPIFINIVRTFTMGLNQASKWSLRRLGSVRWIKRRWRDALQQSA